MFWVPSPRQGAGGGDRICLWLTPLLYLESEPSRPRPSAVHALSPSLPRAEVATCLDEDQGPQRTVVLEVTQCRNLVLSDKPE